MNKVKCADCGEEMDESASYELGDKHYCADCHEVRTNSPDFGSGEEVEVDEQEDTEHQDLVLEPEAPITGESEDA